VEKGGSPLFRLAKWAALAAAVLAIRAVFLWASPAGPEVDVRDLDLLRAAPTDVLIMGDSVMDYVAAEDDDHERLNHKIRVSLRGCTAVNLARSAHHPEIYEPVVSFVTANPSTRPRLVIVPLNLRSFSNSWIKHPAYRFEELRRMLTWDSVAYTLAHRPLNVFGWYRGVEGSQDEYDRSPAYDGDRVIATLGEMNRRVDRDDGSPGSRAKQLHAAFVLRYAQRITPEDDRFEAVIRLARVLRERQVPVLFYLTPVDHETAIRYAGPPVGEHIAWNARVLTEALAREGVVARDWSRLLDASGFSWKLMPNEHLNQAGRQRLAALVAAAAREEIGRRPPNCVLNSIRD
jgi:hypothetical protein